MRDSLRLAAAFGITVLCAVLATALLVISPQPMPGPHTQLFTAALGMFTAGGVALLTMLRARGKNTKKELGIRTEEPPRS